MTRKAALLACALALVPALPAQAGRARLLDATVLEKVYPSEQVSAVLQGSLSLLGACFETSDAGVPRGEVAFQISPRGLPLQLQVTGDLDSACVSHEAVRWHFQPPTGETPQVLVTLELGADLTGSSTREDREREEMEAFCTLFQQYMTRTQDPRELPRKVLRTLIAAGLTPTGERWAADMLATPPAAQLAVFQATSTERGLRIECPEYVGWHQRTFAGPQGVPFELVLVAGEGPSLRALLRNATVTDQWILHDDLAQPSLLVLLDAKGNPVAVADERAGAKPAEGVAKRDFRVVTSGGAVTLREEPFVADGTRYQLHWGPYVFNGVPPGDYRARAVLTSTADTWTDPKTHQRGVIKGLWKGKLESNEVRITLRPLTE
jgi:hypothetical protein